MRSAKPGNHLKGLNCQVSLVGYDQLSAQRKLTVQVACGGEDNKSNLIGSDFVTSVSCVLDT